MPLNFEFDWKKPDYLSIFRMRHERLKRLREEESWRFRRSLKKFYRDNPAQFIIDWGITTDPRNPEIGLPTTVPFLLFPHQEEWVHWFMDRWLKRERGYTVKTREMGLSWLAMATACTICCFWDGIIGGFGSYKAEYVDELDNPKSLFWKGRAFMAGLPPEYRAGMDLRIHCPKNRMKFPDTNSFIGGEVGGEIGRGNRTSFYLVDETAFLEQPLKAEFSLSRTTNCRIDISTPNGMNNPFAQKIHSEKTPEEAIFRYHWRHDPRKDEKWYEAEKEKIDNPLVVARELDCNFADSIEGVLIPAEWFEAAIGAREKLGLPESGSQTAGFDVADEGVDKNALAGRYGIELVYLEEWSGKGQDIFKSVERVANNLDEWGYSHFSYDADGLGAGVRGDIRVINERRQQSHDMPTIRDSSFQGSSGVYQPDNLFKGGTSAKSTQTKRTNKDYFANLKAQSWWALRLRFQASYRAVVEKLDYDPADIISINPKLSRLVALKLQMQQPTYDINGAGKIQIDKMPDGMKSPNLADAVMIAFNPATRALEVWRSLGRR